MNDLLERYLQAVGRYLPAKRREDTLAELRANLLAQVDDQAEERGRALTDAEVAALLKRHGTPILVAIRYLPQRSLIGPALFPFYWFTLRRGFPLVVLVYAIVQAMGAVMAESAVERMGEALLRFPSVALMFWTVVTLVFVGLEFALAAYPMRSSWGRNWDPMKLPPVSDEGKSPTFATRMADVIVTGLLWFWLLAVPFKPYLLLGPGLQYLRSMPAGLSPEWRIFYLQIVVLTLLQLVLKVAALLHWNRRWQRGLALVIEAVGVGALAVMVQARTYFVPSGDVSFAGRLASINSAVNLGFKVALAISVGKLLWDVARLWKGAGRYGALALQ
ncbi:hypothetical protein [Granulicella sp. dw_53]|uniref:hypothetical protein n=1 Tax=Granulicella sp. dw_53 TaxID=2719792 RepID=UPI001BD31D61|nr:hypothetical protein [Granulicella sp. dw_53]